MYQELVIKSLSSNHKEAISELLNNHNCLGSQEFSIDEKRVDEILGDRSYSGGDIPESIIDEVEETLNKNDNSSVLYYFDEEEDLNLITQFLKENNFEFELKTNETQDWNEEWRKHYKPLKINENLEIVPSWMDDYVSKAKHTVRIYPGQGFGTGSHETTYLCLKLYLESGVSPKNILDFGAGSGILGISAQVISKGTCDYCDIDEGALTNNKQNIDLNNILAGYRLIHLNDRANFQKNYDLVFANILKPVLVDEAKNLTSLLSHNGTLILSGLLNDQLNEITELYQQLGLKLTSQDHKGDWGALVFQNK